MEYSVLLPSFDGPLDLLLHLIKQANINICDIEIEEITKQYLAYINKMEEMNLDIASEYLVMAAELIEMKSKVLLPVEEDNEEIEEDPREQLIQRLLEYEQYKESTEAFKKLEEMRKEVLTKEPSDLLDYKDEDTKVDYGITLDNLLDAFSKFLENKEITKPLNTKITNKEYSVGKRCVEIRDIVRKKKEVQFQDLFEVITKEYIVVTFLAILSLSKKQEIEIAQSKNFDNIIIKTKEA
jgi:segregation and condensation protein A